MKNKKIVVLILFVLTISLALIGCTNNEKEQKENLVDSDQVVENDFNDDNNEDNKVIDWKEYYNDYFSNLEMPINNVKYQLIVNAGNLGNYPMELTLTKDDFKFFMDTYSTDYEIICKDNKIYSYILQNQKSQHNVSNLSENNTLETNIKNKFIDMVIKKPNVQKITNITFVEEKEIREELYHIVEVTVVENEEVHYFLREDGSVISLYPGASMDIAGEVISYDDTENRLSNEIVYTFKIKKDDSTIVEYEFNDIEINANCSVLIESINNIEIPEWENNVIEITNDEMSNLIENSMNALVVIK